MTERIFVLLVIPFLLAGAAAASEVSSHKVFPPLEGQEAAKILSSDRERLESFCTALDSMAEEMARMQADFTLKQKGHYTSVEHDQIEGLLFRYLVLRESLVDMVDFYEEFQRRFVDRSDQIRGFLIGYTAGLQLYDASARLVDTFHDEPKVRSKLNEAYHRSEIPPGIYDFLFERVTSPDNINRMDGAWELFVEEMNTEDSPLMALRKKDPRYRKLIGRIGRLHGSTEILRERILKQSSLLLPGVRNTLRHQDAARLAREKLAEFGDRLYAIRGLTFVNVSRLKNPTKKPLTFTDGQIRKMKRLLQPGDIILTYSDGYMSNVFLPGVFKHGITYVGSPDEREKIGLNKSGGFSFFARKREFNRNLKVATLDNGYDADLIEAVAEGVIFNSLEKLAQYHFNRVVVLRARISPEERVRQLTDVFGFLECPYDFKFDFNDASYQCCTELIYRSLNGVGPVRFELVNRMGTPTLSADDICKTALSSDDCAFDFVFLVDRDGSSRSNAARIFTGKKGLRLFKSFFNKS